MAATAVSDALSAYLLTDQRHFVQWGRGVDVELPKALRLVTAPPSGADRGGTRSGVP